MYIPEIAEGEARGRLRRLYQHIRAATHTPLVGDVFRALAHYPAFLQYAMEVSRPNLLALSLEQAADELRGLIIPQVTPPPLPPFVTNHDIRGAARILSVFTYLNAKLLLLTTAWQESLSERPLNGHPGEDAFIPPGVSHAFPRHVPLLRFEAASTPLQHALKQIVDIHRFPTLPSDLRALAHVPTFLHGAWQGMLPFLHSTWHSDTCRLLLQESERLVHTLPHPLVLSPSRLKRLMSPREIAASHGLISLYRHMLPALMINADLMTRQLPSR